MAPCGSNGASGNGGSGSGGNSGGNSGGKAVFFLLWTTQLVSLLGTDVAGFALRLWTYNRDASVAGFAFISFCTSAPALLFSPFAGALVDRYPRKRCMLAADVISCVATAAMALLWARGLLAPWQIYVASAASSIAGSVQWPAFKATVSLLIPPEEYVRYAGMDQAAPAISMLLSPIVAGFVNTRFGLQGAFLLEFATFAAATIATLATAVPDVASETAKAAPTGAADNGGTNAQSNSNAGSGKAAAGGAVGSEAAAMWTDAAEVWGFIRVRPGLVGLLLLLANGHFSSGLVQVLMMPVLLNLGGADVLGYVLSASGTGAVVGAAAVYALSGPRHRRAPTVLACAALQGLLLAGCGVARSPAAILALAFCYMAVIPLNRASRDAVWQQKTPAAMHGRVFGLQRTVAELAAPLAALAAGLLADGFFEPWLREPDGLLVGTAGVLVGTGTGRGAALLFVAAGLANVGAAAVGAAWRPLWRVDLDLPDADDARHRASGDGGGGRSGATDASGKAVAAAAGTAKGVKAD